MVNPTGEAGGNTFYVQDTGGTWHNLSHCDYFKVKKVMNQVSEFEIKIYDIQDAEKVYFKEQSIVAFLYDDILILRGRIQSIKYASAYECTAKGYGSEVLLLDKEYINIIRSPEQPKTIQYDNISAQLISKEILSTNSDGAFPWIIQPALDGIFDTDYGDISIRYENGARLKCLGELANALGYEWWVDNNSNGGGGWIWDSSKWDIDSWS